MNRLKYKHVKFVKDHRAFFVVFHRDRQKKVVFQSRNIRLSMPLHEYDDSSQRKISVFRIGKGRITSAVKRSVI